MYSFNDWSISFNLRSSSYLLSSSRRAPCRRWPQTKEILGELDVLLPPTKKCDKCKTPPIWYNDNLSAFEPVVPIPSLFGGFNDQVVISDWYLPAIDGEYSADGIPKQSTWAPWRGDKCWIANTKVDLFMFCFDTPISSCWWDNCWLLMVFCTPKPMFWGLPKPDQAATGVAASACSVCSRWAFSMDMCSCLDAQLGSDATGWVAGLNLS